MKKAPYDQQNLIDYEDMSKRIDSALIELEKDSSIPATEIKLAELVGCSRGTLRNRVYPLARLKEIKQKRLKGFDNFKITRLTPKQLIQANYYIEVIKKLEDQVKKSRSEIAIWVDKYIEIEKENKNIHRAIEILQEKKEVLEIQLSKLEENSQD